MAADVGIAESSLRGVLPGTSRGRLQEDGMLLIVSELLQSCCVEGYVLLPLYICGFSAHVLEKTRRRVCPLQGSKGRGCARVDVGDS